MGKLSKSDMKDVLPEFQEFLTTGKMVPATNIPWYALRVRKFLGFLNRNEPGDIKLLSEGFIASLRSDGGLFRLATPTGRRGCGALPGTF
jgi:hypothetical protein